MTLFEINENLLNAIANYEDEMANSFGEITDESEILANKIEELQLDRETKIENIALYIKNLTAEADAVEVQKKIFMERQKALENKVENLKKYLTFALNGEKFKTDKVVVGYRKSTSVEISDENEFIAWAETNNKELLNYKPSISKTAIKDSITSGNEVPFANIVEKNSITIK